MSYSEQLEREAEQTRAQFESTLEELRGRLTPGQMVDQFVDYARNNGASEFIHNLGRRTVENPLPVVLVGTGLAWLMLSSGNGSRRAYRDAELGHDGERSTAEYMADTSRSTADDALQAARSAASGMADAAQGTAARLGDTAESLTRSVGERASAAYGSASMGVRRAKESAAHLGHDTAHRARSVLEFCREQPLLLAGLGLALGAAIGAAFPSTETEARLMGESSKDLKSNMAKRMAAATDGRANGQAENDDLPVPTEQHLPLETSPGAATSPM